LEPDECFYIQNQALVRGKRSIDLNEDPPPDLVIEVEVTHSTIDRMDIYAALGVPELWRWDNGALQFWVLSQQHYQQVQHSATFPQLSATDLETFIALADQTDQTTLIRRFRAWVRENLITREEDS
jgi:Uma2 family endonuclease